MGCTLRSARGESRLGNRRSFQPSNRGVRLRRTAEGDRVVHHGNVRRVALVVVMVAAVVAGVVVGAVRGGRGVTTVVAKPASKTATADGDGGSASRARPRR